MEMLGNLQKAHEDMYQLIEGIQIDYHAFLNQL